MRPNVAAVLKATKPPVQAPATAAATKDSVEAKEPVELPAKNEPSTDELFKNGVFLHFRILISKIWIDHK